ncbi:hypothetical protein GCM10009716_33230 [Streptomyces sodiiphilus]|uniref:Class E sortase n=1 Tax=Streptomyces sodiiphilus TaxID=226217 RepID=A0ABP5AWL6_9ACTN
MTAVRPEGGAAWRGQEEDPYAAPGAFEAAVEALDDPLNDPLPGQGRTSGPQPADGHDLYRRDPQRPRGRHAAGRTPSGGTAGGADGGYPPGAGWAEPAAEGGGDPLHAPGDPYGTYPGGNPVPGPSAGTGGEEATRHWAGPAAGSPGPAAFGDSETMALRLPAHLAAGDPETMALLRPADLTGSVPAADGDTPPDGTPDPGPAPAPAPGGRAARRKAAKAREITLGSKVANVLGELMITTGVLLLLFVTYQLWWTNVEARAHANNEADSLRDQWEGSERGADDREPGTFSPGEGFALLYLPTLDVRVPIAESVDEATVLDKGMTGHYTAEDGLPTAMPWDEEGNFGLAGHRNTHGEPFRYINRLDPGDPIVVETETTYYVYEMTSRLDSTSPSNIAVLDPVPEQGGFTEPGRYITLTTCTPEFTSTYRLIVWGQLAEERPRSEGLPDALVN